MKTRVLKILFGIGLLCVIPFTAQSQDSADIDALARVLETLTATAVNNLDFGDLLQGQASTVLPTATTAGQFFVNGEAGSEVELSFTLPSELDRDGGPEVLSISFSGTSAVHNTEDDAAAGTDFDPDTGATTSLNGTNGELYIYIGGTANPDPAQQSGNYEGVITLSVEYTGN